MNLSDYTPEQLRAEANRLESLTSKAPKVRESIDWSKVVEIAKGERDDIVKGDYHEDKDNKHWIYEEVMQAVFEGYFDWYNDHVT